MLSAFICKAANPFHMPMISWHLLLVQDPIIHFYSLAGYLKLRYSQVSWTSIISQTCTPYKVLLLIPGFSNQRWELLLTSPSPFLTTIESVSKSCQVYLLNTSQVLFFSFHLYCLHSSKYIISCLGNLNALLDFLYPLHPRPVSTQQPGWSYYITDHRSCCPTAQSRSMATCEFKDESPKSLIWLLQFHNRSKFIHKISERIHFKLH